MRKTPTALAISPLPALACCAAASRGLWNGFELAGAKLIHRVLGQWITEGKWKEILVLVPDVQDPPALRALLGRAAGAGIGVRWFAPQSSASVRRACTDVKGVTLHTGESCQAAFARVFPPRPVPCDPENADLRDYLRYKLTLSFMRAFDPAPVLEAIDLLAAHDGRPFQLPRSAPGDARSVEHFRQTDFPYIEGQSPAIMALKQRIVQVAATDLSVLLTGETGSGKEFAAFYLHEFGPRRGGPFVSINCAGLDETFLRSELFGHEKGAFTSALQRKEGLVAEAEGGTLFLDELAEMPLNVQADLLRFLQSRRYRPLGSNKERRANIRIVAGTQPVLRDRMRRGLFRDDLYHRLAEVEIVTPPLAAIPEDIPRIIRHVCYRVAEGRTTVEPPEDAIAYFKKGEKLLQRYRWPGNVRELIALVRRRLLLGDDVMAELKTRHEDMLAGTGRSDASESLAPCFNDGAAELTQTDTLIAGFPLDRIQPLDAVITRYLSWASAHRGTLTQADLARRLGISVNTFKRYR